MGETTWFAGPLKQIDETIFRPGTMKLANGHQLASRWVWIVAPGGAW